jgi:peptide-methionine (R)-S-oxide reductase
MTDHTATSAMSFNLDPPSEDELLGLAADLDDAERQVLLEHGTEAPFCGTVLNEKREGLFTCRLCGLPLFTGGTKFESGTGWPSFWQPLSGAVLTSTDFAAGYPRTEVHCARCGGHLGHVFDDGPRPTGKRYCMNGDALTFRPA